MMSEFLARKQVMDSNARLLRQMHKDLFESANGAWKRIVAQFCKRQAEAYHNGIMQFKYKGIHYFMDEDVPLRGGVKPLHETLVPEFQPSFAMFVEEVTEEKRILQNMVAHAIRIAKYQEDLLQLLPEVLHPSIQEAQFFQLPSKPEMLMSDVEEFNRIYEQHFGIFDMRKMIGATM